MILVGDCREQLRTLPSGSVHCVVTSPPYFGLRDYGTASWEGGDPECDHRVSGQVQDTKAKGAITAGVRPGADASRCKDCGAIRVDSQIGLESTPDEYVAQMVEVFREVRRVLRDDGTLWLNIGDSYCATAKGNLNGQDKSGLTSTRTQIASPAGIDKSKIPGLKQKDLIGIPWMVAFALRADGWHLRQDIIWSKKNVMPESVRDRCTKSHEYIFLLTKRPKYFYDSEAIKEPAVTQNRGQRNSFARKGKLTLDATTARGLSFRPDREDVQYGEGTMRNKRDVWHVGTKPFKEAHFATFPPDLIEPCILAGTSAHGVCADCGAPWVRVVERKPMVIDRSERTHEKGRTRTSGTMVEPPTTTTGWKPSCDCNASIVPAIVLDPFFGAGTTGLVALQNGRDYIGCELNPDYVEIAQRRLTNVVLPACPQPDALHWLALSLAA